jgi:hypothetical protein
MANAMLDARQEDVAYHRVELITGQRRRRRWTARRRRGSSPRVSKRARTYPRSLAARARLIRPR